MLDSLGELDVDLPKACTAATIASSAKEATLAGCNCLRINTKSTWACSSEASTMVSELCTKKRFICIAPAIVRPHPPLGSPANTLTNGSIRFFRSTTEYPTRAGGGHDEHTRT